MRNLIEPISYTVFGIGIATWTIAWLAIIHQYCQPWVMALGRLLAQ